MHNIISYSSLENNANSSVSAEREQTITYMDNLRKRKDSKEKKQTVACCFTKTLCCGQTSKKYTEFKQIRPRRSWFNDKTMKKNLSGVFKGCQCHHPSFINYQ